MKIAVISTMLGQPWTGSEELWADTVEAARARGDQLLVSLWQWPTMPPRVAALQGAGVPISFRPRPGGFPTPHGIVKRLSGGRLKLPYPRRFSPYREVLAFRPDVILLSQGWTYEFRDNPDLVAQLRKSKIPLVMVTQANMEEPISDQMRDDLLRFAPRAATIGFVSQGNIYAAQRQCATTFPQAVVVRNPVGLTDFTPVPWPQESAEEWNLASVGRLYPAHKGQDVLLEALSDPVWRERRWKLRFFGAGPERDYIAALIKHYDLEDRVEFGGHVPNVRAIWEKHHLMVMPSRVEGTPLALIEAMWCGRAALVTDVAGHLEWIEEGKSGFIAEAPSANSLRRALERAWNARHEWQQMGEAAHEAAAARYDPQPGQTLLQILDKAARPANLSRSLQPPAPASLHEAQL